jgi:hypothetical protein
MKHAKEHDGYEYSENEQSQIAHRRIIAAHEKPRWPNWGDQRGVRYGGFGRFQFHPIA